MNTYCSRRLGDLAENSGWGLPNTVTSLKQEIIEPSPKSGNENTKINRKLDASSGRLGWTRRAARSLFTHDCIIDTPGRGAHGRIPRVLADSTDHQVLIDDITPPCPVRRATMTMSSPGER